MYERFTDRARKVIQLANQEARRFNHKYVGTEHILLGLVSEGSGVAANVLKNLDIDLRKVRLEVEKIVQSGPDVVPMGKLAQTPKAKKVIEYSIEEAHNLNHNYVGTEHLPLGLLREEEGVAAQVLMNLGLKLEDVREEVLILVGHSLEIPVRKIREYDLYIPLQYSDGLQVEPEKIESLKKRVTDQFGGIIIQRVEGTGKFANITGGSEFMMIRILVEKTEEPREVLLKLKEELKKDLKQEDILIVEKEAGVL